MTGLILAIAFFAWLAHIYIKQQRKKVNLPGPKCLPLFGVLFSMDKRMYRKFQQWADEFGKLIYFNVLNDHFVQISDLKLAKEMFSSDQFVGRPAFDIFLLYEGERLGVINSEGHLWEVHRRFTLRQLRDFGFGKNTMETLIMDEVHEFRDIIKKQNGKPVSSIKEKFSLAVVNSLWTVVSGKRYRQDDPKLRSISNSLHEAVTVSANSGGIIFFFPWLRYIMPEFTGYRATRNAFERLKDFVVEAVEEHQRTYQEDTCRDFIDVYLKEMKTTKDQASSFYGDFGVKQLTSVVGDLFFAGIDTTSTTLAWTILYLATHREVQRKLQKEISSVTGDSRSVSVSDRPNMPYLQATIEEVLRVSSIVPNGVFHRPMSDVTFKGVTYPKGTFVYMSIYHIHHNPEIWGDADNFRPERFLSSDEKEFSKNENVVSFSVGRRQCLGETLARDTLFLFIGNIFQSFEVTTVPQEPEPSLDPAIGFSLNPQEYSVIFKTRGE